MNTLQRYVLALSLGISAMLASSASSAGDWVYLTKSGDTLWDLCIRYTSKRGCWIELAKHNNIDNDRVIPMGTPIRFPQAWLTALPIVGEVVSASGEVSYDRRDSGEKTPLQAGDQVHLGSRVITGQGNVRLRLGDHSEILLRENGELKFDTLSTGKSKQEWVELELPRGEVDTSVDPGYHSRFQISTPAAIAAVRGTRYRVSATNGNEMRSEVLEGEVAVQTEDTKTMVPAGFGIAVKRGEALGKPQRLLPAPEVSKNLSGPAPLEISWQGHPQAASWQVDIYAVDGDRELLHSYTASRPGMVLSELAPGCYKLSVRAADQAGFNGLESMANLCIEPSPPPPAPEPESKIWWEAPLAAALFALIILL